MNLLFFLTPKQDVLFIYEDFTLRQTLEKWSNQRFATIPVLKRNGEYLGTMTEGDILWGIKSIHGLDIDASEDIPIASFPRRRDYKAVPVTTDMHALLNAAVDQNFVPVVDDRNVFIGIVRRTAILQQVTLILRFILQVLPLQQQVQLQVRLASHLSLDYNICQDIAALRQCMDR